MSERYISSVNINESCTCVASRSSSHQKWYLLIPSNDVFIIYLSFTLLAIFWNYTENWCWYVRLNEVIIIFETPHIPCFVRWRVLARLLLRHSWKFGWTWGSGILLTFFFRLNFHQWCPKDPLQLWIWVTTDFNTFRKVSGSVGRRPDDIESLTNRANNLKRIN